MKYSEALRYLYSFTDYEKKTGYSAAESFDLRRPRELLALLGDPQGRFPSILVAGTKGKGSTSAMVASILRAAGLHVGFYSQPHLHTFRERIRVDDWLIGPQELADVVEAVAPAVEELMGRRPDLGFPTTYEVATAAAMHYFASRSLDLVVLEVGLGGRLDATNVVEPLISVITPISLDHVQILGNTIAEIAREKAGIIKEGGLVVAADQTAEALDVIRGVAAARSARLLVASLHLVDGGEELTVAPLEGRARAHPRRERTRVVLRGPSGRAYRVELPLLGAHQLSNAATAIAVVEELGRKGFPVDEGAVERGLAQVRWPGRLEILSREPLVVADGAHNVDSAGKLAAALRESFAYRRLILVLATSADKDVRGIAAALCPAASAVIATRSRHPRAADPARLMEAAREFSPHVEVAPDLQSALALAMALADPADLICVTGSLFIVADAREHFGLAVERD